MKNEKFWKGLIVLLVLALAWVRLSPSIAWTMEGHALMERYQERFGECYEYEIVYEWSWWSLRFTSVYPKCS
jgi:hypothetical protein